MLLKKGKSIVFYTILTITTISCTKFVEVDGPGTELGFDNVYADDTAVEQAITGMYTTLLHGFSSGNFSSITYLSGLSSDELILASEEGIDFYLNAIHPDNGTLRNLWDGPYNEIYAANLMIEGLDASKTLTPAFKQQAYGEARFIRAFSYFYLINLFGGVPLPLTTDYRQNGNMARTSKQIVYDQIITDLKEAQNLLSIYYPNNSRVRANKWVATALLARVYLYRGQWSDAESQASSIIERSTFNLCPLDQVFLMNSNEAIWQLQRSDGNSQDAGTFVISEANPIYATLRPSVVASFEKGDNRATQWVTSRDFGGTTYFYPYKYRETVKTPIKEYSTVLRLSEQYLIRAEARAWQGKITGVNSAESDINIIRRRAGLGGTTARTAEEMKSAIEKERLCELFTEWGHRWFDLKRTRSLTTAGNTRADDLLKFKAGWRSTDTLYPIPQIQIDNDPAMKNDQNPGY